jgi:hypothetical protein
METTEPRPKTSKLAVKSLTVPAICWLLIGLVGAYCPTDHCRAIIGYGNAMGLVYLLFFLSIVNFGVSIFLPIKAILQIKKSKGALKGYCFAVLGLLSMPIFLILCAVVPFVVTFIYLFITM